MKILAKTTIQMNDTPDEYIVPLTKDWIEIEYDFGSKEELESRHPFLYPEEIDSGEYEVSYVTDDNGNEYGINEFMKINPPAEYTINGEIIKIHAGKGTSNFGGIGLELDDNGDVCRLYKIWS